MRPTLDQTDSPSTTDVAALIADAAAATDALFARTALDRRITLDPGLPRVLSDHNNLVDILTRLIASAVQFSVGGRVTIGAAERAANVELWVSDDGAALSAEAKEEALQTAGKGPAEWRKLIADLGGHLKIEPNTVNGTVIGTTVRLSLPTTGENNG